MPDLPRRPRCAGCNQAIDPLESYWLVELHGDHDEGVYAVVAEGHVRCIREWGYAELDGWLEHRECSEDSDDDIRAS